MKKKVSKVTYEKQFKNLVVPEGVKNVNDLLLTPEQQQFLLKFINNKFIHL